VTEEKPPESALPADNSSPADAASAEQQPTADAAPAEPPPPEPLTPERLAAENRRNDLFIIGGVIVVAFLMGAFKINDPMLWVHLKSGSVIAQQGIPDKDPFSYTAADRRWVNSQWLFDWALYRVELAESRSRVLHLADEYQQLLEDSRKPKLDEMGRDTNKPLPKETLTSFDRALAELRDSATKSDSAAMRLAAERMAEEVRRAGLKAAPDDPLTGQPSFRAIARYQSPGGGGLIKLMSPVVLKCVLLAAAAGVLLFVRRPESTFWWTSVVTVATLVGMSDRLTLSPEVFSLFFLAIVFWILWQFDSGRPGRVWLLVPLELVWVNLDGLFAIGLLPPVIVLLCNLVSRTRAADLGTLGAAVAASIVATLVNPFHVLVWGQSFSWIATMLGRLDFVAASLGTVCGLDAEWIDRALERGSDLITIAPDLAPPLSRALTTAVAVPAIRSRSSVLAAYLPMMVTTALIVLAIVSSFMNRRAIPKSRVVVLVVFTGLFLVAYRFVGLAALAAGVTLSLNGQEWFVRRFGEETRITRGWLVWSQGGRAVTVAGLAALAFAAITGWIGAGASSTFGFGIRWAGIDLDAARLLRAANLKGRAINTVPLQGNLLIWANYPNQVYVDGRASLHRPLLDEFTTLKLALRDDDKRAWQPVLDKHSVSHVLLNLGLQADRVTFRRTFGAMLGSKDWKLVHLDSTHAVFGRVDFPVDHPLASDAAWFRQNTFDPTRLAFKTNSERLPDPPPPVTPPTFVDRLWRTRRTALGQSELADHLLDPRLVAGSESSEKPQLQPENCLLAVRAARRQIANEERVSSRSYAALSDAYFFLFNMELATGQQPDAHDIRRLELLAALHQLVTANPTHVLGRLHLAFRYLTLNFIDLADEHLDVAINLLPEEAVVPILMEGGQVQNVAKTDLIGISERLKINIERVKSDMIQLGTELNSPGMRVNYYLQRGCPGLAIQELTEAVALSLGSGDASPMLADLYIRTGQAGDVDRGAERELRSIEGTAGERPGVLDEMWGKVKLMQGDYEAAKTFWEKAIAETRHTMIKDMISIAVGGIRHGGVLNMALEPFDRVDDADRQARLEFQLGMLQLEAGEPNESLRHFEQSLAVRNDAPYRPLIGFYMEAISGKKLEPLPEPPKEDEAAGAGTEPAKSESAKDPPPGEQSKPAKPAEPSGAEPAKKDKTSQPDPADAAPAKNDK